MRHFFKGGWTYDTDPGMIKRPLLVTTARHSKTVTAEEYTDHENHRGERIAISRRSGAGRPSVPFRFTNGRRIVRKNGKYVLNDETHNRNRRVSRAY